MTQAQKDRNRYLSARRASAEQVFRVLKCQFGYRKTRYRGLRNAQQLFKLFALVNLYQARKRLMA